MLAELYNEMNSGTDNKAVLVLDFSETTWTVLS